MMVDGGHTEDLVKPMVGELVYCEHTRHISRSGGMIRVAKSDAHELFKGNSELCKKCMNYESCEAAETAETYSRW